MSKENTVTLSLDRYHRLQRIEIERDNKWIELSNDYDDYQKKLDKDYEILRTQLKAETLMGRIMAKWFFKK